MKLLLILSFLISPVFAKLSESEKSHLRQMSMTFCSCRGGTYFIAFDTEKPLAKVFCKNNESRVFYTKDQYGVCK
jgi:hypothetical protein